MKIKSDIAKKMQKEIGLYTFEVGILQNAPKKLRKKGATKSFAGLQINALGSVSKKRPTTIAYVGEILEKYHFKWLTRPFKTKGLNEDVKKVVDELAAQIFGKKSKNNKRLENAVQAVIRNPILRSDYGKNMKATIKAKGFDKLGIDTGQFFKAIKAKRM
jgi:hypothetical protein